MDEKLGGKLLKVSHVIPTTLRIAAAPIEHRRSRLRNRYYKNIRVESWAYRWN